MVEEGLWLMAIGMSGVFGFLLLLVGMLHVSGRVFRLLDRWLPEPVPVKAGAGSAAALTADPSAEEESIAVALAVASSRKRAGV